MWELYQARFGENSYEVARSYLELAQAHLKKKDFGEAINFQHKALKVYTENANNAGGTTEGGTQTT